ncbi:glutamate-cysteine ligase catalytic subunit [Achlya hypogyna]|uniref:Glutamate--cysteine ligase n=1 Tax=Achlya hypogyna TaxID=1202772 RepID=A0A1V9Z600_ACHHY|nr:glutamate-cysteine ligase catalytic subunit [Achlya hypogyna]
MGLLVVGTPLRWEDALPWLHHVRRNGIQQFLETYHRVKDIRGDVLKWGDELEYGIFELDPETKTARLSLRGSEVLHELMDKEERFHRADHAEEECNWVPEYGAWMVEATPRVPYGGFTSDLRRVEQSMRLRRARLLSVLKPNEIAPTVTAFPLLGVGDYVAPPVNRVGPIANSLYIDDRIINPHPRFGTLTANIRTRRTENVDIRVPIFKDVHTKQMLEDEAAWVAEHARPTYGDATSAIKSPQRGNSPKKEVAPSSEPLQRLTRRHPSFAESCEPHPGFIHMDAMAFGMGMCCLQVTFQAKNIGESRHLYDHLGVLSPIMLALTAATPILKGRLADTDVRWATIAASVDDRTPQERGVASADSAPASYSQMAGDGVKRLPKSRYEGISAFICNHKDGEDCHANLDHYNNVEIPYDEESYETLRANGVDDILAKHIAHLFIRDPLVLFEQRLHLDNKTATDHFENIQSTNWQTVRWKPPPPPSGDGPAPPHIGWRTEFRSMEIQLTDFENAAFSVFMALVSRVILAFDLNLYVPLSKVNANMEIAHRVNAATEEVFYFRRHLAPPDVDECHRADCHVQCSATCLDDAAKCIHGAESFETMTIAEIMLGKGCYYPGLIPLVNAYLDHIQCDDTTRRLLDKYLALIAKRATGELPTAAAWMRRFVRAHPDYAHDSVVTPAIAHDLLDTCAKIGEGTLPCPELLGDVRIEPIRGNTAYQVPLKSESVDTAKRSELLQRYVQRGADAQ